MPDCQYCGHALRPLGQIGAFVFCKCDGCQMGIRLPADQVPTATKGWPDDETWDSMLDAACQAEEEYDIDELEAHAWELYRSQQ